VLNWTGAVAKTVQLVTDILLKPAPLTVTGVPAAPDLGERATAGVTANAAVLAAEDAAVTVEVTVIS
jgi:hypothetical protein